MSSEGPTASSAFRVAALAILTAVVAVFTMTVRVPSPIRGGYFSLSDVAIVFVALTFGPFSGAVTAAVGTAAADLLLSSPQWAPISFLVHGAQGLVVGLIGRWIAGRPLPTILTITLAGVAGVIVMAGGYLAGGTVLAGFGQALTEVPGNLIQSGAGAIFGPLLALAVRRPIPPSTRTDGEHARNQNPRGARSDRGGSAQSRA